MSAPRPPTGDAPVVDEFAGTGHERRRTAHEARADALLAGHLARRSRGEKHPVEDFLFTYYSLRPSRLRRWNPGLPDAPADVEAYLAKRGDMVRFVHTLLTATASRPTQLRCFGLHEWAMVYRQDETRHQVPLRLGVAGTDAVVEQHQLRCSHYDAYRFFTPQALPRNAFRLSREEQIESDRPGCLHVAMDLYKWAGKLGEPVPAELLLDCFELARDVRTLDMQASPYDLSSHGYQPVQIETPAGKAEYVRRQKQFAERAEPLRARMIEICETLLPERRPR